MKYLYLILLFSFSVCFVDAQAVAAKTRTDSIDKANNNSIKSAGAYLTKLQVSKSDSSMWLTANMKRDHRIFGYEKPDINSKRELLISIFTNDVEGNPFHCPLGSYYQTSAMEQLSLKFIGRSGKFIKVKIMKEDSSFVIIYILNKWVKFEK